tara:strand:+ start:107 stop:292 length:186 start_codon:yes stop_codon:yes gene_type:complete
MTIFFASNHVIGKYVPKMPRFCIEVTEVTEVTFSQQGTVSPLEAANFDDFLPNSFLTTASK